MAKGALYWRHKDEKTGKWTYRRLDDNEEKQFTKRVFEHYLKVGVIGNNQEE